MQATKYCMTVDGMNGGSTDTSHARWFEITGFDFDTNKDGGVQNFSTLAVDFAKDAGQMAMLKAATLGSTINGLRIEGVADVGGVEQKVYQLALTNVIATSVQESSDAGYHVDFDFQKYTLRTFGGQTGAQTSLAGWDRLSDSSFSAAQGLKTAGGLAEAQAGKFLFSLIDHVGDTFVKGYKGFMNVESCQFSMDQPSDKGTAVGPSESGTLDLVFMTDNGLTGFFRTCPRAVPSLWAAWWGWRASARQPSSARRSG